MAKKYILTEENKKQLNPWAEKWIANNLSCEPMSSLDKEEMVKAINGMYAAAKLPLPKNIVFVPSPFVLRVASGFASAIWWNRKNKFTATDAATLNATSAATLAATRAATYNATLNATYNATRAATDAATRAATRAATYDATRAATYDATDAATLDATDAATLDATDAATLNATYDATLNATYNATYDATDAATLDATYDATRAATYDATDAATLDATDAATLNATYNATYNAIRDSGKWYKFNLDIKKLSNYFGLGMLGMECAVSAYRMVQGGNQWSAWTAFISFFRHIAKLDIDYTNWDHWEKATIHGGPRVMHPDFCMVSDRPKYIKMDEQNRPHCFDGPFVEWRDGSSIYSFHGVRVPAYYAETKAEDIDPLKVLKETSTEVRMAVIKKCGFQHFLKHLNNRTISTANGNSLIEFDFDGISVRALHVKWKDKFSDKETVIPVPKTKEEFQSTGAFLSNPDDCEQVRRWVMWDSKGVEFVKET